MLLCTTTFSATVAHATANHTDVTSYQQQWECPCPIPGCVALHACSQLPCDLYLQLHQVIEKERKKTHVTIAEQCIQICGACRMVPRAMGFSVSESESTVFALLFLPDKQRFERLNAKE